MRFDLAGGWPDTPPYTLREGGRVVNLAVDLNGQPPIQVFCRRTAVRHVRVHSIDLGHTETFTRFEELRDYRDRLFRAAFPGAAATAAAAPEIEYVARAGERPPLRTSLKEDQIVWARAPVRLDLAGGWTDTPPYTLRQGGRVVNLAANLNGQPPIQVFCRRTLERHVRVHSIDLGHTETFTRFEELLDYRDPLSPFALLKAALCLMGLDGAHAAEGLAGLLDRIGSGLEITLLCAVPS